MLVQISRYGDVPPCVEARLLPPLQSARTSSGLGLDFNTNPRWLWDQQWTWKVLFLILWRSICGGWVAVCGWATEWSAARLESSLTVLHEIQECGGSATTRHWKPSIYGCEDYFHDGSVSWASQSTCPARR